MSFPQNIRAGRAHVEVTADTSKLQRGLFVIKKREGMAGGEAEGRGDGGGGSKGGKKGPGVLHAEEAAELRGGDAGGVRQGGAGEQGVGAGAEGGAVDLRVDFRKTRESEKRRAADGIFDFERGFVQRRANLRRFVRIGVPPRIDRSCA